jgi:hypothetical protein
VQGPLAHAWGCRCRDGSGARSSETGSSGYCAKPSTPSRSICPQITTTWWSRGPTSGIWLNATAWPGPARRSWI